MEVIRSKPHIVNTIIALKPFVNQFDMIGCDYYHILKFRVAKINIIAQY
jgi:hypothetical protein